MSALPSLHRRIRTSFLRVVFLFWCTGMLMLAAVWFTGRLPLQMVRLNYDSIVWASEMERACDALLAPRLYPERTPAGWRAFFEDNLERAEQNVTERDEGTALAYVRSAWEEFQKAERPDAMAVKAGLRELERINEKGLFQRLDAGLRWRDAVLLAGAACRRGRLGICGRRRVGPYRSSFAPGGGVVACPACSRTESVAAGAADS